VDEQRLAGGDMSRDQQEPRRTPVAVVTGSRAEFGLLRGSMDLLSASSLLEPLLIVAGMHLDERLGNTWREVEARFSISARVPMSPPEDSPAGMALAVAEGIRGFTGIFRKLCPRLLLVLGDRIEPYSACVAAAYQDIPVAHIHGGDVTGDAVDDFHRDSISRMARLHFPATERSRRRLVQMGVQGEIEVVGAPGLDAILGEINGSPASRNELLASLGMPPGDPVLVVIYHPVPHLAGPDGDAAGREAAEVLSAAAAYGERHGAAVAVLYPNNDAGHLAVIREIESWRGHPRFRIFTSLPRDVFLDLLRSAEILLGNSSSGIIESVSLGLAAVNVGTRQAGRERNANVVDAPPRGEAILRALEAARRDPAVQAAAASRRNLYGDGTAARRIVRALEGFLAGENQPRGRVSSEAR